MGAGRRVRCCGVLRIEVNDEEKENHSPDISDGHNEVDETINTIKKVSKKREQLGWREYQDRPFLVQRR